MTQSQPTTIGERIRAMRVQRGMTQEQLAELTGMYPSTISRIEGGQRSARPDTIQRLATALDVSQWWLMLGDDTDRHLP